MSEPVKKPVAKNMIKNAFLMMILAIFMYMMSGKADEGKHSQATPDQGGGQGGGQ